MKSSIGLLRVLSGAFFITLSSVAVAQNAGTVTNHAIPLGRGAGVQGYGSLALTSGQIVIGQASADPQAITPTGDVTISASGVTAIGANKVLNTMIASMTSAQLAAILSDETGSGLAYFTGGALGTPASGTGTNLTGIPIGTGISGLGTGCATFLATPSSANLRGCLTDEVGTGAAYFIGGALGTPASATLTNGTGLPIAGITGLGTGVGTALGNATNSAGGFVTSPVPYANMQAGTSDTAIGFWGSTVASALAINNCSNALTYSTSTHTFGCNSTAGTGTVTSAQVIGAGLTVNSGTCTITSTGACTVTTPAAVKSDMITATSTTLAVTPGEMSFSPYSMKVHGLLVISGGTTATLQPGSAGITSVAYTSTGQYKVNFSTAFANATYDCTTSATGGSTSAFLAVPGQTSYTVSQVSITVLQATAFGVADPSAVSIQCAGLQ